MRIVLVDDHALFRDGVASLLGAWGHEVVGQAADGAEAMELAGRLLPDLVLMDVRMPGVSGLEATARIKERHPGVAIVMLTVSEDEDDLFRAIKAGAQGYLLKNLESAQLRTMLEAVSRGEAAISPATAARIIDEFLRVERGPAPRAPDRLTERELEVLRLVTQGLRNKEIAARLGISENTAKFHLKNIVEKLHAQTRTELAARAVREGLVPELDAKPSAKPSAKQSAKPSARPR
ncbi:MAG: response regulator [Candidatus Limnocylindrales bacterium]